MKLPEYIRYPNPHAERWRLLDFPSRSIAHGLFAHCDDYGLVCIQRIEMIRIMVEAQHLREHVAVECIQRIVDIQVAYLFEMSPHGRVLAFPDYPAANPRPKWPKATMYQPIPFEILMAEPSYATSIAKYDALIKRRPEPEHADELLPRKLAIIEQYNAFAEQHKLDKAHHLTTERSKYLDDRLREPHFDFDAIMLKISESAFLLGKTNSSKGPFHLRLEFIIQKDRDGIQNYLKILDGHYADRNSHRPGPAQGATRTSAVPDFNRIRDLRDEGHPR